MSAPETRSPAPPEERKKKVGGQQQQHQQQQQGKGPSKQQAPRSKEEGVREGPREPRQNNAASAGGSSAPSQRAPASSSQGNSGGRASSSRHEPYRLKLFDQLLPKKQPPVTNSIEGDFNLHPATLKLGALYKSGQIRDDDDRLVALLQLFCTIVDDYTTPPNKSTRDDLDKHIRAQFGHLVECRQHCMGMGNLVKQLRLAIAKTPADRSEADAKLSLKEMLKSYLEEKILFARQSIANNCASMIKEHDVIMTYGSSPLIRHVLMEAAKVKSFRLVVVDSRPLCDGLATLQALSPHIHCVYTPLSGAASMMREVTRVLLGASALFSNGTMMAPAGSAMVASLAKGLRVPVIVAAEIYKFCEKVQLDSIVFNELGSQQEIVTLKPRKADEAEKPNDLVITTSAGAAGGPMQVVSQLTPKYRGAVDRSEEPLPFQVINLRYDVTPIGNISVVATETGLIPPTSVPVIIRELSAADDAV